jgi:tetraacyldisaccharide 4'-kinase
MLAQRCDAPLWVGADRVAAARALLEAHPDCDVILSDDGLQHYRLARDFEIAVIDGKRGFGNALMLPVGPLREPPARLASVDAIVINVTDSTAITVSTGRPPSFAMSLVGREFHNLLDPQRRAAADEFRNRRVHAVAGIGDPVRFFNHLRRLGLDFTEHPFRDHHPFSAADVCFDDAECVVMTAKDAVKCRQFAKEYHWVLPVTAEVDPDFGELVLRKLRK